MNFFHIRFLTLSLFLSLDNCLFMGFSTEPTFCAYVEEGYTTYCHRNSEVFNGPASFSFIFSLFIQIIEFKKKFM